MRTLGRLQSSMDRRLGDAEPLGNLIPLCLSIIRLLSGALSVRIRGAYRIPERTGVSSHLPNGEALIQVAGSTDADKGGFSSSKYVILGPARWAPPVPRKAFRKIVATCRAVTDPGHQDLSPLTPDPWVCGYRAGWDAFLLFQNPSH